MINKKAPLLTEAGLFYHDLSGVAQGSTLSLAEHGLCHGVAQGGSVSERCESFVGVLFHQPALDEAHGQYKEGYVVTIL